jgi:putative peptidoglycan lipid II flippase
VIQVLLPVPWLRGRDDRLRVLIDWRDPAVRQVFLLMVPVTLSLGLINFNAVVDTLFASRLIDPELAPTAIDKAFRIYMLPQGMFSVAVATVLFPSLARLAARRDLDRFRETVSLGLRQIAFLLVPASVVCAVLAAFSAGLTFNGMMLMSNRAFFSLQSNWVPTLVALGNLGLNAALDAAFYRLGVWGIPLATSLVNMAGTAALLVLLRRRIERIDFREVARATASIVVAAAALAGVCYGIWWPLDRALDRSLGAQILSLGTALAGGGAAYVLAARLLGVRELSALRFLRARLRTP